MGRNWYAFLLTMTSCILSSIMLFLPVVTAKTGSADNPEIFYSAPINSYMGSLVVILIVTAIALVFMGQYTASAITSIAYAVLLVVIDFMKPSEFHDKLIDRGLIIISESREYGHYILLVVCFATLLFAGLSIMSDQKG